MTRIISSIALLSVLLSCGTGEAKRPGMCAKEPMAPDGIVRLSKIEVYPQYLDEYVKHAAEVGEVSLRTEPGVLTMYAVQEREAPCRITILETYASRAAYDRHIDSEHFRKYKQETLHMSESLEAVRPVAAQSGEPNQQLHAINATAMNRILFISLFSILTLNVMAQEKIVQTAGRDQLGDSRHYVRTTNATTRLVARRWRPTDRRPPPPPTAPSVGTVRLRYSVPSVPYRTGTVPYRTVPYRYRYRYRLPYP